MMNRNQEMIHRGEERNERNEPPFHAQRTCSLLLVNKSDS